MCPKISKICVGYKDTLAYVFKPIKHEGVQVGMVTELFMNKLIPKVMTRIKPVDKIVIGHEISVKNEDLKEILKSANELQLRQLEIYNGSENFNAFSRLVPENLKVVRIFNYQQFKPNSDRYLLQNRPDFRLCTSNSKKNLLLPHKVEENCVPNFFVRKDNPASNIALVLYLSM